MIPGMDPVVLLIIQLASRAFDVPAPLIYAVGMRESNWNLHALGDYDEEKNPHSFGPMQLNDKGAGAGYPQDLLLNPAFNIFLGTEYLKACLDYYPNNLRLALAAYRQGPGGAAQSGYAPSTAYVADILRYYEEAKKDWGKGGSK